MHNKSGLFSGLIAFAKCTYIHVYICKLYLFRIPSPQESQDAHFLYSSILIRPGDHADLCSVIANFFSIDSFLFRNNVKCLCMPEKSLPFPFGDFLFCPATQFEAFIYIYMNVQVHVREAFILPRILNRYSKEVKIAGEVFIPALLIYILYMNNKFQDCFK